MARVALALIPEVISFSIIAGVDPQVGLFSSFVMAVTIAVVGGRPAMISAGSRNEKSCTNITTSCRSAATSSGRRTGAVGTS